MSHILVLLPSCKPTVCSRACNEFHSSN